MRDHDEDRIPAELEPVVARLRERRAEADPLQLDQIKLRARARLMSGRRRPSPMRSRLATIVTIIGLVGGTSGAVAVGSQGGGDGNGHGADHGQYRPGKGCGDKNHEHSRSNECKGGQGGQGGQGGKGGGDHGKRR
jgi:hypothetical protein